jgi:uncharacterized coiled-coil protein SlyX
MSDTQPTEDDLNAAEMATFITGEQPDVPDPDTDAGAEAEEEGEEGENQPDPNAEGEEGEEAGAEDEPKRRRSGAERYRRQRERAEAAEARVAALEARFAALESGQKPNPTPDLTNGPINVKTGSVKEPNPAEYAYGDLDPGFIADLADYKAELKVQALRDEMRATEQQKVAQREAQQIKARAEQAAQVGSERYADFNEVVIEGAEEGEWPLTQPMLQAALESDHTADILYYLATNVAEAEKVSAMGQRQLDRWLGRMEMQFERPAARKASKAPPPVSSARGSGGRFSADPATSDFAAFEKMAQQGK